MELFQYTRLSFGVSSAPATFQRDMKNLLQGMWHLVVYLDAILITGTNDRDHLSNLRAVLITLQKTGLNLKREKCVFFVSSVEYLGHIISMDGLAQGPR